MVAWRRLEAAAKIVRFGLWSVTFVEACKHGQQSAPSGWVRGRYRYLLLLRKVAALQRWPRSRSQSGRAKDQSTTNCGETFCLVICLSFVWMFSSLLEVIIGQGCLLSVQSWPALREKKRHGSWAERSTIDVGCCQAYLWGGERVGRGENRSRKDVSKLKTRRKKPLSKHEIEYRRVRVWQPKLHRRNARRMHHRMQWSDTRSILLCMQYCQCHVTHWAARRLFCWVEGQCCLAPADQVSSDSATKLTSDKNMFGGGRRRSPQACVRQGRCQKTPTLTLLAEVLTVSPAWRFFSLETMYFELLFEVLAWRFVQFARREDVVNFPLLGQLDGLCMCLQWRSYETGVEKAT